MKLIAHRGGSFGKENSLETFIQAAKMGADAIECDIRRTKDGVLVIYHDESLGRLAGVDQKVSQTTFADMKTLLAKEGRQVLTFRELVEGYHEKTPILMHIKLLDFDPVFAKELVDSGLPLIAGVVSREMLSCFARLLPPEKILAFMPDPSMAERYYAEGAGILRLWEQWLEEYTPAMIKEKCPNAEVFIMACNLKRPVWEGIPLESMDGSAESLAMCEQLGADGVLLNNIQMALAWRDS